MVMLLHDDEVRRCRTTGFIADESADHAGHAGTAGRRGNANDALPPPIAT